MKNPGLEENFEDLLDKTKEVGFVTYAVHQLIYADGLPNVRLREVVRLESGEIGQVLSLSKDLVEILVFSKNPINVGTRIARTQQTLSVPVGEGLLGAMIGPLGTLLSGSHRKPSYEHFKELEEDVPGIDVRKRIDSPLETGVALVDLLIPLGTGQRQLIMGDKDTGKTGFILQAMLSQAKLGTVCIYAGIGKKRVDVKKVQNFLAKHEIEDKVIMVVTSASDSVGEIYLTPYSAMSIAEYFRNRGVNTLLILDDMTTHAKFYREMSLLARRFPGKGAYPGDIFYIHSKLLERAGNFKTAEGNEVSITCLPVVHTVEGDISGYIQTNLMSMTDGHIFFDKELFMAGRRPAIHYFLSVTRVGRQTQSPIRWGISRELTTFLNLYDKSQNFVHFGAEINEGMRATLDLGAKVLSFFDQPVDKPFSMNVQVVMFCLLWIGAFKDYNQAKIKFMVEKAMSLYLSEHGFKDDVDSLVDSAKDFNGLLGKVRLRQQQLSARLEVS